MGFGVVSNQNRPPRGRGWMVATRTKACVGRVGTIVKLAVLHNAELTRKASAAIEKGFCVRFCDEMGIQCANFEAYTLLLTAVSFRPLLNLSSSFIAAKKY